MKIKLTMNVPVSGKEGMTPGRELETIDPPEGKGGIWVQGDVSPVRLWNGEYEQVQEVEEDAQD